MKRTISLFVALVMVAFMFAACQAEQAPAGEKTLEESQLVVVMPAAAHGWIAAVVFFAEQKGQELGIPGYRVLTSASVAEQAGQLDELISQRVDAIVLFPHSDELSIPAERVVDAGIPLFLFNRNVHADYVLRLLGSNIMIGAEGARVIAEGIGGSGVVAYLAVPSVGSTNNERLGSFWAVMEEYPDIQLVTMTANSISIEEGLRVTTDMLTANPQVDAIFTIDDSLSIGALQAVREAGRSDIQFINGAGGAQIYFHMIHETEDIWLFSATYAASMIKDTIDLAVEYLEGRRDFSGLFSEGFSVPNVVVIPPVIIDRNNVEEHFAPGSPW